MLARLPGKSKPDLSKMPAFGADSAYASFRANSTQAPAREPSPEAVRAYMLDAEMKLRKEEARYQWALKDGWLRDIEDAASHSKPIHLLFHSGRFLRLAYDSMDFWGCAATSMFTVTLPPSAAEKECGMF
jgi:hypothetical protein